MARLLGLALQPGVDSCVIEEDEVEGMLASVCELGAQPHLSACTGLMLLL